MIALMLKNCQVIGMSLNVKFIDSNVFIYALLKPKRSVDEKIVKMKEKAKEILT
ncbi:hypothetical protein M1627_2267 [Sulfolobus islandicus M.16.27]|uniref:PIN domain protein n=2 Tax=Saccharolobus islandicus TaxID=43080 RepID=F0NCH9_SACI5|nr:hypothetical protein M1627_2267 [Sulfolobus islandicus M.16.27]ADX86126.1 PIN domain protein [Sulfolobus islandicus REY15A]